MSSTQVVVLIVVVLVVLIVAAALWFAARRRALRQRFGPEYDRAVAEGDSRLAVERELRERERRHAQLELRDLDPESRDRYAASWNEIQARFLDDPNTAVNEADELVTRLAGERGYPTGDYDEQVANLSVDHARTLGNYRDAHEIYLVNARGEATTEQLRQAVVHYRALFSDLLGTDVTETRPGVPEPRSEVTETDTEVTDVRDETGDPSTTGTADAQVAENRHDDAADVAPDERVERDHAHRS
jgi:hypothetical protein